MFCWQIRVDGMLGGGIERLKVGAQIGIVRLYMWDTI